MPSVQLSDYLFGVLTLCSLDSLSTVNPEGRGNLGTSPPQYPFDGLIRELGGDPEDPADAHLAAHYHGDTRPFRTIGFDKALRSEGKVWN